MQFAELLHHRAPKTIAACVFLSAILVTAPSACTGQEATEHTAVNRLIALVEKGELGQSEQAKKLYQSLPAESKCKPVAALALTMVLIREKQFSDAWKMLNAAFENSQGAAESLKLAMERFKLWLLLEADAAEKAEPQFVKMVKLTLAAAQEDAELAVNCSYIGSVAGMVQTDNESPCISSSTTSRAMEKLLEKVESTNAKMRLQEHLEANRQWGTELVALVGKFERLGQAEGEQQLSSAQAELENSRRELTELRAELKSAGGEKRALEDHRKKWFQSRKAILQEMTRETPGKPQYPVAPGPAPRAPTQRSGHYKVDRQTLAAEYVPPTAAEVSRYRDEMRDYEKEAQKWRTRSANYQRDYLEYPNKIKLWEQQDAARRASLNDQKQKADLGISSAESTMKGMQDEIKQGVGKDLNSVLEQQKKLERLVAMSTIALRHVAEKDIKPKRLIRPTSFPVLDYEAECSRLKKSLRER